MFRFIWRQNIPKNLYKRLFFRKLIKLAAELICMKINFNTILSLNKNHRFKYLQIFFQLWMGMTIYCIESPLLFIDLLMFNDFKLYDSKLCMSIFWPWMFPICHPKIISLKLYIKLLIPSYTLNYLYIRHLNRHSGPLGVKKANHFYWLKKFAKILAGQGPNAIMFI
jgi:hypothetical protein